MPKLYIGADHRGFQLKNQIKLAIQEEFEIIDLGPKEYNPTDDFPKVSFKVGEAVANSQDTAIGILICGSSFGVNVAANKVKGIVATNPDTVAEAIEDKAHHGGNVLCLTADEFDINEALEVITAWTTTKFLEGKYQRRMQQIKDYENN